MKRTSCLAIINNSLQKGNEVLRTVLRDSIYDKSKSFDKAISMMYETCLNKITSDVIEKVYLYNLSWLIKMLYWITLIIVW